LKEYTEGAAAGTKVNVFNCRGFLALCSIVCA
jgi:hypothetical protein